MTPAQLRAICPHCVDPDAWAPAITEAWQSFRFTSPYQRAGFIGITANESGGYRAVHREDMRYRPARAAELFPKARNNPSDRHSGPNQTCIGKCNAGPEAVANWVYADIIGNGDEASGDGWRFRGGGVIQLTGRANYRACGQALGIDLEANPDLLTSDPKVSAAGAAWFVADYARILHFLDSPSEELFLAGASKVGWSDETATARRLEYRRKALLVLGAAPADPDNIAFGDRGDRVMELQAALVKAGLNIKVDRDFGEQTRQAVKDYQQYHGLAVTGVADADTRRALGV